MNTRVSVHFNAVNYTVIHVYIVLHVDVQYIVDPPSL